MRYTITPSLLNSWLYMYSDFEKYIFDTSEKTAEDYRQAAYKDFLITLNRVPIPTNEAMQKGIDFENLIEAICAGHSPVEHKWFDAANEIAHEVMGAQFQITAKKNIEVAGWPIQLKGRLDSLKAGIVGDFKFSSKYEVGKFFGSPQHPIYMELISGATVFVYYVSNGSRVWRETYTRAECRPVGEVIQPFLDYLQNTGLNSLYKEKWIVNE